MRRICLTGVPGSGKTALAHALTRAIPERSAVIDNYAGIAERRLDLAIGFEGSYISNINVALERLGRERNPEWDALDPHTLITCGSLIETSTYMAMQFEASSKFWTEEERPDNDKRIRAGLSMLACLYMDSFHYDKVYYLPPFRDGGDQRLAVMDRNLQAAFQAFWLTPTTPLMVEGGSLEEITAGRLELIMKEGSEVSDEGRAGATSAPSK